MANISTSIATGNISRWRRMAIFGLLMCGTVLASGPCQSIVDAINQLEAQVAELEEEAKQSSGKEKAAIVTKIGGLNTEIASKKQALDKCLAAGLAGTGTFPDLELVHYQEQFGIVPQTQLHYGIATLRVRAINRANTATDSLWLSAKEFNVLLRQQSPAAALPALQPGASVEVTLTLQPELPPAQSQLGEDQQFADWQKRYQFFPGVNLICVMDWRGPAALAPAQGHRELKIYQGLGDSTPCQEGANTIREVPPGPPVCDGNLCITLDDASQYIHQRLDCRVTGYSLFLGEPGRFESFGKARTSADGPAVDFTPATKIVVASVSKIITTLAAIRVLEARNIALSSPIGPYLPKDWSVDLGVAAITFQQLLSHTSGILDYGNNDQDYPILKQFFAQKITPGGPIMTNPVGQPKPAVYSNYNFSIFRILLPMVDGFVDNDPAHLAEKLAVRYVNLVQLNVFSPVGVKHVECKPPADPAASALAYAFPGDHPGWPWGDMTLKCGADGWYLSAEDMAKVLISVNQNDVKILYDYQVAEMENKNLGWDCRSTNLQECHLPGYPYLEKNGGLSWNGTSISTSIGIFGPRPGILGVLFMNSDIMREQGVGADIVLRDAFLRSLSAKQ